jgi:hypothetical protein
MKIYKNDLSYLLIELSHLLRVDVLAHVAALEEALDAAHLFDNLKKKVLKTLCFKKKFLFN